MEAGLLPWVRAGEHEQRPDRQRLRLVGCITKADMLHANIGAGGATAWPLVLADESSNVVSISAARDNESAERLAVRRNRRRSK